MKSKTPNKDHYPPLLAHANKIGLCPNRSSCRETTLCRYLNDRNATISIARMSARKEDTKEAGYVDKEYMRVNKVLAIKYPK